MREKQKEALEAAEVKVKAMEKEKEALEAALAKVPSLFFPSSCTFLPFVSFRRRRRAPKRPRPPSSRTRRGRSRRRRSRPPQSSRSRRWRRRRRRSRPLWRRFPFDSFLSLPVSYLLSLLGEGGAR